MEIPLPLSQRLSRPTRRANQLPEIQSIGFFHAFLPRQQTSSLSPSFLPSFSISCHPRSGEARRGEARFSNAPLKGEGEEKKTRMMVVSSFFWFRQSHGKEEELRRPPTRSKKKREECVLHPTTTSLPTSPPSTLPPSPPVSDWNSAVEIMVILAGVHSLGLGRQTKPYCTA